MSSQSAAIACQLLYVGRLSVLLEALLHTNGVDGRGREGGSHRANVGEIGRSSGVWKRRSCCCMRGSGRTRDLSVSLSPAGPDLPVPRPRTDIGQSSNAASRPHDPGNAQRRRLRREADHLGSIVQQLYQCISSIDCLRPSTIHHDAWRRCQSPVRTVSRPRLGLHRHPLRIRLPQRARGDAAAQRPQAQQHSTSASRRHPERHLDRPHHRTKARERDGEVGPKDPRPRSCAARTRLPADARWPQGRARSRGLEALPHHARALPGQADGGREHGAAVVHPSVPAAVPMVLPRPSVPHAGTRAQRLTNTRGAAAANARSTSARS